MAHQIYYIRRCALLIGSTRGGRRRLCTRACRSVCAPRRAPHVVCCGSAARTRGQRRRDPAGAPWRGETTAARRTVRRRRVRACVRACVLLVRVLQGHGGQRVGAARGGQAALLPGAGHPEALATGRQSPRPGESEAGLYSLEASLLRHAQEGSRRADAAAEVWQCAHGSGGGSKRESAARRAVCRAVVRPQGL